MADLRIPDLKVISTGGEASSTVSRRADGQAEKLDPKKAVTPGVSSSRTGLEAAEQIGGGVTHNQGAELKANLLASTSIEASHTDH